jgi:hypothetical protein
MRCRRPNTKSTASIGLHRRNVLTAESKLHSKSYSCFGGKNASIPRPGAMRTSEGERRIPVHASSASVWSRQEEDPSRSFRNTQQRGDCVRHSAFGPKRLDYKRYLSCTPAMAGVGLRSDGGRGWHCWESCRPAMRNELSTIPSSGPRAASEPPARVADRRATSSPPATIACRVPHS